VQVGAIDRLGPNDVMYLATEGRLPANFGAVLRLDGPSTIDVDSARRTFDRRTTAVPRLRQRVRRVPLGFGRPLWVDADDFDIARQVTALTCPPPGDERALLDVMAEVVQRRFNRRHPLWRAVLVEGLEAGGVAVVLVVQHALADGIGGLAVLAGLVDGMAPPPLPPQRRRMPPLPDVFVDAMRTRWLAVRSLPAHLRELRHALVAVHRSGGRRAPTTSLNRPTGVQRRFGVVSARLADVVAVAHEHDATVNDVALTAAAGALRRLLADRGEAVDRLVFSIPAAARPHDGGRSLGNAVGVMPVQVPTIGDPWQRLAETARRTRAAKQAGRGIPPGLVDAFSRVMAALRLAERSVDHQHMINTFLTNVRGPETPLRLLGRQITQVVPVSPTMGNVTASFCVFSYAGNLTITVVTDPQGCPEGPSLERFLDEQLAQLTGAVARAT